MGSDHDLGLELTPPVREGDDVALHAPALIRAAQHAEVALEGPRWPLDYLGGLGIQTVVAP